MGLRGYFATSRLHFWWRYVFEWLAVLLLLSMAALYAQSSNNIELANNYIYDRLISVHEPVPNPQIVVVAIDNYSLQELGHWPWSMATHQKLFEQLAQVPTKGILFDVLLLEPTQGDAALGKAMAQSSRVVLPALLQPNGNDALTVFEPVAALGSSALVGNILVHPDSDGVLRKIAFHMTDETGRSWPLATSLLLPDGAMDAGHQPVLTPLNIGKAAYQTVPYAGVVNGQVPLDFFKDKYVLIGATAAGLGDQYVTSTSGLSGLVSGIEIHANILDNLLAGRSIVVFDQTWMVVLNWAAPLLLLLLMFFWLNERYHFVLLMAMLAGYLGIVAFLLYVQQHWLPPTLTVLLLLLAYLIWSWRRLSVVLSYVKVNLQQVQLERSSLSELIKTYRQQWFVPRSIELGMQQIQRLYQFTHNSLDHMPTALLVARTDGQIVLTNQDALRQFNVHESDVATLLHRIDPHWQPQSGSDWLGKLHGLELNTADERVFVLHVSAVNFDEVGLEAQSDRLWLMHFLELTQERWAQKQRSELIEYLSHDMRSPQVAILSLLDLQADPLTRMNEKAFHQKIAARVQHTLDWAYDLSRFSHAQAGQYKFEEVSLATILDDALDQLEPQYKAKRILIHFTAEDRWAAEQAWLSADGPLLARALGNIVSNAIRYSALEGEIVVQVHTAAQHVHCSILDHGCGMSAQQVEQLLHEKVSLTGLVKKNQPDAARSMGVGFLMARTVVQRHGGHLAIESQLNVGTRVTLVLPLLVDSEI